MADELKLNHLTEQGNAHMVDVSEKAETKRIAIAEGFITMQAGTLATVLSHRAKKGDVIATARIAGIMAAKKTSELIPLCHPVMLTNVTIDLLPSGAMMHLRPKSKRATQADRIPAASMW